MTATDELRRMLDEHGVEYATDDNNASNVTMWTTQNGGWVFDCDYMEPLNAKPGTIGAKTELMIYGYTPEQAVEATLGRGECKNISNPPSGFLCSECGWGDFAEPSHLLTTAKFTDNECGSNYCQNCGKAVKR